MTVPVPTARALRRRLRATRPRRTAAGLLERAVYTVFGGALAIGAVRAGSRRIGGLAVTSPDTAVTRPLGAVLTVLALVLLARALLAIGPLYAGAAERTWLLGAPVDRGRLLTGHLAAATAAGAAAGAAVGGVLIPAADLAAAPVPWPAAWATAGTLVACACVLVQAGGRTAGVQRVLGAAACALAVAAAAVPLARPGLPAPPGGIGAPVAAVLLLAAALAIYAARRALDSLDRSALASGAELASATRVSVLSLDFSYFSSIVLERRARATGRVRPARIRGNRFAALVRADVARVRRDRTGLIVWAALVPLPYAAHLAGLASVPPALHLVTAWLADDRLAGGLRAVARSPALRRALGGADRSLRLAHLVVPGAGAAVWSGAAAALAPGVGPLAAAISAAGALAVVYRTATRPPMDYGGPVVDFGAFGAVPVGLVAQLARGPALLAAVAVVQAAVAG
ncbi:DUF6297 family protein [Actinomadura atramentaria]|uniref:DUF6297 family protein n=1 Tax=Actinomadura atramentaria TaxID=1990 RepID=UPI000364A725|nr:DUF6297 family protein [Actinomadura atramentaria]